MKKALVITLSIFAVGGLGYLVYRKISDMNKTIINEGTFTIKVDETETADASSYSSDYADLASLDSYQSYGEEPSWTSPYDQYGLV